MRRGHHQRLAALVLLCVVLAATSCGNQRYRALIATFEESVETTSAAVGSYFTELNEFERELYLQDRVLDPSLEVAATDDGVPTPLVTPVFDPDSIKARMEAIRLLGVYGRRLAELAGTEAPAKFASNVEALGGNLEGLANTFGSLKDKKEGKKEDATAEKYAGPVAKIIGVVGQMILERKRDAALTAAIRDGAPAVRNILDLLENDLNEVVNPQRRTGALVTLASLTNDYNERREGMSKSARKEALEEIRRAAHHYELVLATNPAELIQSMRDAHEALVRYAESDRRPENLAEVVARLEEFHRRAQRVSEAVHELRQLRKGEP